MDAVLRCDFLLISTPSDDPAPLPAAQVTSLGYQALQGSRSGTRPTDESVAAPALFVRGPSHGDWATNEATGERIVVCGVTTSTSPAAALLSLGITAEDDQHLLQSLAEHIQGNWVAAAVDEHTACIITDHMGSWPVYVAPLQSARRTTVYGTSLHDVVRVSGCSRWDVVSVEEFDGEGAISSPFTLFQDVTRLWPGTLYRIPDRGRGVARQYWLPQQSESPADIRGASAAAREAIDRNLEHLVHASGREPIILMFSGGEDSRALAAAMLAARRKTSCANRLEAAIFLDARNREYYLAKSAATVLGLRLRLRLRDRLHYSHRLAEMVRRCGPGIDVARGGHSIGLLEEGGRSLHVDGWTSDSFLKGLFLPVHARRIRGIRVGLDRPATAACQSAAVRSERSYGGRWAAKQDRVATFRDAKSVGAWSRMWPISDHEDFCFFAVNSALRRSASPLLFGNVISAIAGVPEEAKLNRRLFRSMFRGHLGWAGWIPRTDGELPALPAEWNLVPTAINQTIFKSWDAIQRRLKAGYDAGPWQSYALLSRAAEHELRTMSSQRIEAMSAVLGRPAWEEGVDPHRLFRRIQLAHAIQAVS